MIADGHRIGDRLRRIRAQQGLSLADVQQRSEGRWKAVVVGAYERGDRAITVAKLAKLAAFYGVELRDVLPPAPAAAGRSGEEPAHVRLDLTRLDDGDPVVQAVARFVAHVRHLRGDHNGRVLTLRGGDLTTIAMAVGTDPDQLHARLSEHGAVLATA